jgi:hypothetical protein
MNACRTLAGVAGLIACLGVASCGSTATTATTVPTATTTAPTVTTTAAKTAPPTVAEVKRCLQAAGYSVAVPSINGPGAGGGNSAAEVEIQLEAAPGAPKGEIEAFILRKPSAGIAAWFEVYETDADAKAAVAKATKTGEQTEKKATENGVSAQSTYQAQSVGDVAYVATEGDPSAVIASCARA